MTERRFNLALGKHLCSLREGAGLSQVQLADKLSVHRNSVWKWEAGSALTLFLFARVCMALDADPSVIYAELLAGTYTGALHHDDMRFDSPYNTYIHAGLPPGPIANPGKSALESAMHPAQSDYYYFVADAQGHHRFARTFEEHNKNVAAYRKAMREGGAAVSR